MKANCAILAWTVEKGFSSTLDTQHTFTMYFSNFENCISISLYTVIRQQCLKGIQDIYWVISHFYELINKPLNEKVWNLNKDLLLSCSFHVELIILKCTFLKDQWICTVLQTQTKTLFTPLWQSQQNYTYWKSKWYNNYCCFGLCHNINPCCKCIFQSDAGFPFSIHF